MSPFVTAVCSTMRGYAFEQLFGDPAELLCLLDGIREAQVTHGRGAPCHLAQAIAPAREERGSFGFMTLVVSLADRRSLGAADSVARRPRLLVTIAVLTALQVSDLRSKPTDILSHLRDLRSYLPRFRSDSGLHAVKSGLHAVKSMIDGGIHVTDMP